MGELSLKERIEANKKAFEATGHLFGLERLARKGLLDADEVSGLQGQLAPLEAELETSPEPLPRIREKPDNPIPGAWSGIRPFQLEMPEDHPLGGFDPPAGLRAPAAAGVP